ncbi:Uncharacterized protein BCB44BAC_01878 [Bacillus cytotoxicus]|uniref:Uncharacterized protein n=1 Tax=Bacillus cytotoxicus TaxID=580165 RepID=A0AAX2CGG2_9BACI|nr:Uncharacterized protein BCB44BAC_01878 [Bacillus cytotoxicus]
MEKIPNEVMGRVDSLLRLIILLTSFTFGVSKVGGMLPFYTLSILLICAMGIALRYVLLKYKEKNIGASNKSIV